MFHNKAKMNLTNFIDKLRKGKEIQNQRGGGGIATFFSTPFCARSQCVLPVISDATCVLPVFPDATCVILYYVNLHSFIKSWLFGMQQFSLNPANLKIYLCKSV